MKHLSETPLPESFPTTVQTALGNVDYDPDRLPTTAPVASATPTPTISPVATESPTPTATPSASSSPSASPSPTVKSVKKTITCVKNGKTIKVTGTNPKCPTGYKIKK
jgi:hypothetical protein